MTDSFWLVWLGLMLLLGVVAGAAVRALWSGATLGRRAAIQAGRTAPSGAFDVAHPRVIDSHTEFARYRAWAAGADVHRLRYSGLWPRLRAPGHRRLRAGALGHGGLLLALSLPPAAGAVTSTRTIAYPEDTNGPAGTSRGAVG